MQRKADRERMEMERRSRRKISIGTITFFRPKPQDRIGEFTLAFSHSLLKSQIQENLIEAFGNNLIQERIKHDKFTKSVLVRLYKPILFCELRKILRRSFEESL